MYDHAAVVAALLDAPGAAVNGATVEGWTPLHIASFAGFTDVVSALLAHPSADVNARTTASLRGIHAGATPLRLARDHFGHVDVAALLEARGGVV